MGHFDFKRFSITDDNCGMRLSTDAVLLGSWVDVSHVENIVDAGCGSGVIALMMAQRTEKARLQASIYPREHVRMPDSTYVLLHGKTG